MMPKFTNLAIFYGPKKILEHLTLDLKPYKSLTILGANGSGKSSLAKAISGIVSYEGSITINDREIHKLHALDKAKQCAYIPAKLESFDLQISVAEFVLMGRFAHKKAWSNYAAEDFDKVDEALKTIKLSHLKEQSLATLSSGEQQLIMIAQALVQEAPLLIFDEPTAHLDPKNVVAFIKLFKELQKDYTLLLITHDIHLAQSLDQPVLFIQDHHATLYEKAFFTPETLLKHYGVPFSTQDSMLGLNYE